MVHKEVMKSSGNHLHGDRLFCRAMQNDSMNLPKGWLMRDGSDILAGGLCQTPMLPRFSIPQGTMGYLPDYTLHLFHQWYCSR